LYSRDNEILYHWNSVLPTSTPVSCHLNINIIQTDTVPQSYISYQGNGAGAIYNGRRSGGCPPHILYSIDLSVDSLQVIDQFIKDKNQPTVANKFQTQ